MHSAVHEKCRDISQCVHVQKDIMEHGKPSPRKLEDIREILSLFMDADVGIRTIDQTATGVMTCPLPVKVTCHIVDDGFDFSGVVIPYVDTGFKPEAVRVKVLALDSIPSGTPMSFHPIGAGNPSLDMHVPFDVANNLTQLCDAISIFIGRLQSLAHFLDEYGIESDAAF